MFDIFGNQLNRAALCAMFDEHGFQAQNRIMQRMYDAGMSGPAIAKVFNVESIYRRIDAHRGRGPGARLA